MSTQQPFYVGPENSGTPPPPRVGSGNIDGSIRGGSDIYYIPGGDNTIQVTGLGTRVDNPHAKPEPGGLTLRDVAFYADNNLSGNTSSGNWGGSGYSDMGDTTADTISISRGSPTTLLAGGQGNEEVSISGGADRSPLIDGGGDTLALYGGAALATISGSGGNDSIFIQGDGNTISAVLDGGVLPKDIDKGEVSLVGNNVPDTLTVRGGYDGASLYGGIKGSTIADAMGNVEVSIYGGTAHDTITISGGESSMSGASPDTLMLNGGTIQSSIMGNDGNDSVAVVSPVRPTFIERGGNDTIAITPNQQQHQGHGERLITGSTISDGMEIDKGAGGSTITTASLEPLTLGGGYNGASLYGGNGGNSEISISGGADHDSFAIQGGLAEGSIELDSGKHDDSIAVTPNQQTYSRYGKVSITETGKMPDHSGIDALTISGVGSRIEFESAQGDDSITFSPAPAPAHNEIQNIGQNNGDGVNLFGVTMERLADDVLSARNYGFVEGPDGLITLDVSHNDLYETLNFHPKSIDGHIDDKTSWQKGDSIALSSCDLQSFLDINNAEGNRGMDVLAVGGDKKFS